MTQIMPQGNRMDYNKSEVMLTYIQKENPELFERVVSEVEEILPEFIFKDYTLIPDMLVYFCSFRGINISQIKGRTLATKQLTRHRTEFLAVLLLCYHPEKINGITRKRTWQGIQIHASEALQCNIKSLANFIPNAIGEYYLYQDFKQVVKDAHELITERYQAQELQTRDFSGEKKNTQLDLFQ